MLGFPGQLTLEQHKNSIPVSAAMTKVTYYVALPFVTADDGIVAGEPTECVNPSVAVVRAEALSRKERWCGRIQPHRWSRYARFSDAKVIRKFGDVPDDLSAL